MQSLKPLLIQEPLFGGFFLYSASYSYYYPAFQMNYSWEDQLKIKSFLVNTEFTYENMNCWIPFELSDRTVLIRVSGIEDTICGVMVDPSLDESVASASDLEQNILLFYASDQGIPYTSKELLKDIRFTWTSDALQTLQIKDKTFQLLKAPLNNYDIQLCYLIPHTGIWQKMNLLQKTLLFGSIALFMLTPIIWSCLYRKLLNPLNTLSQTMKSIGEGNPGLRADENYSVSELRNFSITLNQMLDNINNLKLEAYEKKLDLQQARLQYLQLQIRPHFYLNCLKGLYSMAERQQYHEIQESVLALSDYFRYIFRNNKDFVELAEEIHSVSSYINLQQLNFSTHPKLTMEIAAETAECMILPLSALTFVENSIKHSSHLDDLKIHIKSTIVSVDDNKFLNITISDNSGGFSDEALDTLNHLSAHDFRYRDYHVGIYNIYYRMALAYDHKGILAFYNTEEGGCVELFIPINSTNGGQ